MTERFDWSVRCEDDDELRFLESPMTGALTVDVYAGDEFVTLAVPEAGARELAAQLAERYAPDSEQRDIVLNDIRYPENEGEA